MRIEKLQQSLLKNKLDAGIIYSLGNLPNVNLLYLTGYSGIGICMVPSIGKPFLLVPAMEYEKAKKTGIRTYKAIKKKRLLESLSSIISRKKLSLKKIGIDKDNYSLLVYEKMKKMLPARYLDISSICKTLRSKKEDKEIACIKKACKVTDKIFSEIINDFTFKTEKELKRFIMRRIEEEGCETAFPPIVASGKNASIPHYEGESKIGRGLLLLDFGAKYKGYCSDMSRTICIGHPKKQEATLYGLLLKVQEGCISQIKEKKRYSAIYEYSNLALGPYKKYFIHSLGHGLGLEIHEIPGLNAEETATVENNTCFTIEPGIYIEGKVGIRIEDTVCFRKEKLEVFTRSGKQLICLKIKK